MNFIDAMQTNDLVGENGMPTHSTSGSKVLDFFSSSGAMRNSSEREVLNKFSAALAENPLLALKALFYARDVRGGQGERKLFRLCFRFLCMTQPDLAIKNLPNVVEFGRFDDLMATEGTLAEGHAAALWLAALADEGRCGLAAKWVPRRGPWFGILRATAGMTASQFRKAVVTLTDVVEQKMCAQQWDQIEYPKVPSRAALIYRKAFARRDGARYGKYLEDLKNGVTKINAATLYPSDLVGKYMRSSGSADPTVEAQWKALPDWMGEGETGIIPVCDVSGSMTGMPMQVSVALGIYLSERNKGPFKDVVVTFDDDPQFVSLSGNLKQRVGTVSLMPWGGSTNLQKVFVAMLNRAQKASLPADQMPSTILIISDMQFNSCITGMGAMDVIKKMYTKAGYPLPSIIFWNVRDSIGKPGKKDEQGVGLVSGYSPSIMKAVLGRVPEATPMDLMLDTLGSARYNSVVA